MKKRLLLGIPTVVLATGYVINDNEFKMAFDRDYKVPDFLSGSKDDTGEKEMKRISDKGIDFIKGLDSEYIMLRNSMNNVISATFIPSKNKTKKFMILSHGYRNDGLHEFGSFFPFYYEEGINLLVIDHQGHGTSEGKYITFGYQESLDIHRWIEYLVQNYGEDIEIYLHGISMGAATVCMVAGSDSLARQVKGVISDCAYANTKEQLIHTLEDVHAPLTNLSYKLCAKKLEAKCNAKLDEVIPEEAVKNCKIPMVFIHGLEDDFVPTNNAIRLFDACQSKDKELILVEKAGHAKSYWFDRDRYQQAILEILSK